MIIGLVSLVKSSLLMRYKGEVIYFLIHGAKIGIFEK
jgi:hypothetical protein